MFGRNRRHRAWGVVAAAVLLCVAGAPARALDAADANRTGSVEVVMRLDGEAVGGGVVAVYRIGDAVEEEDGCSFAPVGACAEGGFSFDGDLQSADLARQIAEYLQAHDAPSTRAVVNGEGRVVFDGLTAGLYLVVQVQAAPGYEAAAPFVVGVPSATDGTCRYDVVASPKVEPKTETNPPEEPDIPKTGDAGRGVGGAAVAVLGGAVLAAGAWALGRGTGRNRPSL